MLLDKAIVFTFSRYRHRPNIHEMQNTIYSQPGRQE